MGSTALQVSKSAGQWLLETDLPSALVSHGGTSSFTDSYTAVPAPLYGASGPSTNASTNASANASANDINQGSLGDCYLLASLAEVAFQQPDRIASMITSNGTYGHSLPAA